MIKFLRFDERFKAIEDYELYFRLRQYYPVLYRHDVVVTHRHSQSFGSTIRSYFERSFYFAHLYHKFAGVIDKNEVLIFEKQGFLGFLKICSLLSFSYIRKQNLKTILYLFTVESAWYAGLCWGFFFRKF